MANPTYDSFLNNDHNPFVEQMRRETTEASNPVKDRARLEPLIEAGLGNSSKTTTANSPPVDDSENEEAPNSGFVIHVATEPGKGKV